MYQLLAMLAGAGLGAAAGSSKKNASTYNYTQVSGQAGLEKRMSTLVDDRMKEMGQLTDLGPGKQDILASLNSSRSLADMLQGYSQGNFNPSAYDQVQSNAFAQDMFAPQRQQLSQNFTDMQTMANRQAGRMGRAGNDPILMNKLMQEQTRQTGMLDAQQRQLFTERASQMPFQRLDFAQQLAGVQGGLASQAMANRLALLNMGQSIRQGEQQYRLAQKSVTNDNWSGGTFGDSIRGMMGGMGAGASMGGGMGGGG